MKTKILLAFLVIELLALFCLPCPCKAQTNDTLHFDFRECFWQLPETNSVDTVVHLNEDGSYTVSIAKFQNFHPPYFTRLITRQPSRLGSSDGAILVEAEPGTGKELKYSFSNGVMSNVAEMLPGGEYTAYVKDENGCVDSFERIQLFYFTATPVQGGIVIEYQGNDKEWMTNAGQNAKVIISDINGKLFFNRNIYFTLSSYRNFIPLQFSGIVIVNLTTKLGSVSLERFVSQN